MGKPPHAASFHRDAGRGIKPLNPSSGHRRKAYVSPLRGTCAARVEPLPLARSTNRRAGRMGLPEVVPPAVAPSFSQVKGATRRVGDAGGQEHRGVGRASLTE